MITRAEAAMLLAAAAGRDQRTIGEADVLAWYEDLHDLDLEDCRDALRRHYRESTERVMPAHVRRLVKLIYDERRRSQPHEIRELPSRFEGDVTRDLRLKAGVAQVREVLGPVLERLAAAKDDDKPALSESDLIRQRALEMARESKRGRKS